MTRPRSAYRTESGLWRDAGVTRRVEGDRLVIDADCNGFLRFPFGYCRADVTLTVPADVVCDRKQLSWPRECDRPGGFGRSGVQRRPSRRPRPQR